jgi:hypothetical protein
MAKRRYITICFDIRHNNVKAVFFAFLKNGHAGRHERVVNQGADGITAEICKDRHTVFATVVLGPKTEGSLLPDSDLTVVSRRMPSWHSACSQRHPDYVFISRADATDTLDRCVAAAVRDITAAIYAAGIAQNKR